MGRVAELTRDAVTMDPRIRARREAVERDRGRRFLRRLRWVAMGAAAPALLFAVTRSPALDVDRIEVGGARRSGAVAVAEMSGVAFGDPITDVDLSAAAQRIEAMPWVRDAIVDRSWPGTLKIQVTERVAVAATRPTGADEGTPYALLDESGRVLAQAVSPMGLPVVDVGAEVPAPGGRLASSTTQTVAVAAALPTSLVSEIGRIWRAEDGVRLARRAGGDVLVGDASGLDEKLDALATVLTRVDLTCLATLDLRVASAPVLTRVASCG